GDALFNGTVIMSNLLTGTENDVLIIDNNGVIKKKTLSIIGEFGIADASGTNQFNVSLGTDLRFEGSGDTSIAFNPVTNTVIITSIPGSGTGGAVTSFNGRTGAVIPQSGDYTTSI